VDSLPPAVPADEAVAEAGDHHPLDGRAVTIVGYQAGTGPLPTVLASDETVGHEVRPRVLGRVADHRLTLDSLQLPGRTGATEYLSRTALSPGGT